MVLFRARFMMKVRSEMRGFRLKYTSGKNRRNLFVYLLFYVVFNSQGHIATGSLQVEETNAYCTVNHRASASNCQLSNMKRPARDSNWRPQRLEARTLTATPPSPQNRKKEINKNKCVTVLFVFARFVYKVA